MRLPGRSAGGSRHVRSLTANFGNPSSVHSFGQEARAAVDRARREVAGLIGARQNELIFVSGGTEANNLAIRGLCEAAQHHGQHIITSTIEHPSVRGVLETLEKRGWEVTGVPVSEKGIVKIDDVGSALRPDTVLVSIMLANNEIGTIQPIAEIGNLIRERRQAGHRIFGFTDAVQAAGRLQLNVDELGCDLLSLSDTNFTPERNWSAVRATWYAHCRAKRRWASGTRTTCRHRKCSCHSRVGRGYQNCAWELEQDPSKYAGSAIGSKPR